MKTSDFNIIWKSTEIHDYINREAHRYSKRQELQEEYFQEGWAIICAAPAGLPLNEYIIIAEKSMNSAYRQNYKESLAMRAAHNDPDSILLHESDEWVEEEFRLVRDIRET